MGGAIIQLVAYGSQNIYLTGDPQITYWKTIYKRYTNFATESIQQDIIGSLIAGNYVSVVIARNGDLLKGLTLQYSPSEIYRGQYVFYNAGGVPSNLGNTIFKQLEFEIGGNLIDRHYGVWLTIWSNLNIQSYIAPIQCVDNYFVFDHPVGAEPTVCNQYARMSFNHNQLNTYVDRQFTSSSLYSNPDATKFRGMLAYPIVAPSSIPTSGVTNLVALNVNQLVTFDNPLQVIYLFYQNQIPSATATNNFFLQVSALIYSAPVTIFGGCFPYGPSVYPGTAIPVDTTNYNICNVFEIYTGAVNAQDYSPPAITNIIPDDDSLFNIRIDNPTNNWFNNCKGTLTIYSNTTGDYYNIVYGSPKGKQKYFVAEGYLVIYYCVVLNPPATPVTLTNTDLVVPTGTDYPLDLFNLSTIYFPINLMPTSGIFCVCGSSPIDLYSNLAIVGPLPIQAVILLITVGGVDYIFIAFYIIGTAYYDPVTRLYHYLLPFVTLDHFPTVPTPVPNGLPMVEGNIANTTDGAPSEAYIPLKFWFCRNPGLALPLIALQYHEVKLNLQLATWQELHAAQFSDINLTSIKVYAEYVYLDTTERRQFSQNAHEYLIDQLQFDTFNNSFENNLSGGTLQININFSNCVKELVICGTPVSFGTYSQGVGTPNRILNTVAETSNVQLQLKFNQGNRFSNRNIKYFTRNQIWDYHKGSGSCNSLPGQIGTDNIGVYSFALKPGEYQPSGTCNFSRISKPELVFSNFDSANGEQINSLNIYAVNYNILRIMSGMGNIAYAY